MANESDDLAYVRYAWGSVYRINSPVTHGRSWQAIAMFGSHDVLTADSADELLSKIRRHYPGLVGTSVAASQP